MANGDVSNIDNLDEILNVLFTAAPETRRRITSGSALGPDESFATDVQSQFGSLSADQQSIVLSRFQLLRRQRLLENGAASSPTLFQQLGASQDRLFRPNPVERPRATTQPPLAPPSTTTTVQLNVRQTAEIENENLLPEVEPGSGRAVRRNA